MESRIYYVIGGEGRRFERNGQGPRVEYAARRRSEMAAKEHWKDVPDDHDYPAAADYLSLVMPQPTANDLARRLRSAPVVHRKAKDLLRASRLPLLGPDNLHVAQDLNKVKQGRLLSPVLLVRGRLGSGMPLTVADGYHRICASYHLDEDADIPCRIVDLSKTA